MFSCIRQTLFEQSQLYANARKLCFPYCCMHTSVVNQQRPEPIAAETDVIQPPSWNNALPFESVPRLPSLPIVKAAMHFLPILGKYSSKHMDKFADDICEQYGDVVLVDIPSSPVLWLFNVDDFPVVFHNEGTFPRHMGLVPLRVYRQSQGKTGGIATLNGDDWYEIRSKIQRHTLLVSTVESHVPKMQELSKDFLRYIASKASSDGMVYDLLPILQTYAIEVIFYIIFNFKLNCFNQSFDENSMNIRLRKSASDIMLALGETVMGNQLWRIYPTKGWKRLVRSHEIFTKISMKYIEEKLAETKIFRDDDLGILLTLFHREKMKPDQAVIMIMDLLLGGSDSASSTSCYLLHHLACNPHIQEKLYEEIQSVVGDDVNITPNHINQMTYHEACIKETLRFEPVVPGIGRILDDEVVLSNYRIPANTNMLIATSAVMRQERYFPNAKKYIPERWLDPEQECNPFAYLPFGHGARACLGKRIAQQEIHVLLLEILRNYKLETDCKDVGRITGITNRPGKPVNLRLIKR